MLIYNSINFLWSLYWTSCSGYHFSGMFSKKTGFRFLVSVARAAALARTAHQATMGTQSVRTAALVATRTSQYSVRAWLVARYPTAKRHKPFCKLQSTAKMALDVPVFSFCAPHIATRTHTLTHPLSHARGSMGLATTGITRAKMDSVSAAQSDSTLVFRARYVSLIFALVAIISF